MSWRRLLVLQKRLLIDTQKAKDAYQTLDIANVALIKSACNTADALTKSKPNFIHDQCTSEQ